MMPQKVSARRPPLRVVSGTSLWCDCADYRLCWDHCSQEPPHFTPTEPQVWMMSWSIFATFTQECCTDGTSSFGLPAGDDHISRLWGAPIVHSPQLYPAGRGLTAHQPRIYYLHSLTFVNALRCHENNQNMLLLAWQIHSYCRSSRISFSVAQRDFSDHFFLNVHIPQLPTSL